MSFSTQVWLRREGTTCLPGRPELLLSVLGGNEATPIIGLPRPDGTKLRLIRQ
ncbi:hypothetical protein [Streptomyces sp. NPDC001903]|uniref:hypothetical protein n=1 Tax=Streptomyces sp. NPDC001903 TaxID=3364622 RepID=UPI0036AE1557